MDLYNIGSHPEVFLATTTTIYMTQAKYNDMAKYTLPKYYLAKYTLT